MKRHHIRRTGLVAAGLAVAVVFFALGALVRLLLGPVSLGPFSGELAEAVSSAVPGLSLRYDGAAVQWSRDEGRVNLVILGARIFDRSQRIIAQAPKAEIDLAAAPFLRGKVVVRRIALVGVQLTLVHTMAGELRLGVERDKGQSDLLANLREALSSGSGPSSLQTVAVRRARLAFYDERTGLFVVAPQASLQVGTDPATADKGGLKANISAKIEISGHAADLIANVTLPADGKTVSGDVSIRGLDIDAVGENAKALAFLKPYAIRTDVTGSFILDHGSTRVRYADFGLGASGTVHGFGHPLSVKTLRLVGRYDGRTGRLLIDDGTLAGKEARAHLTGDGTLAFNSAGGLQKASVDLTMDRIGVDMPGIMQKAFTLTRMALRASYTPADNHIAIDNALISGGPLSASFKGDVTLSPGQTPAIAVTGRIAALPIADLLHYWPLRLGEGARSWIAENVTAGTLGPVTLKTNIAAGALDAPTLPDDALSLSFPIHGGQVTYVKGLTPLSDVEGSGTLTGDTFLATVASATIAPPDSGTLRVSDGRVSIPKLHVADSPGDVSAHVDGALSDVFALLDMKPLEYPTRFHIRKDSAKGAAAVDLKFHVPMVHDLGIDDVGIAISGTVDGLALQVGSHEVTDGTAKLAIDNAKLHVEGLVNLAGSKLAVTWDEAFKTKDPITTRITANGTLSDATREKLNFHSGDFLKGPVSASAKLEGHRGSITNASMTMQLTPAAVALDLINYRKPPGVAATVQVTARFKDGAITGEDIALSGAGLNAQGSIGFGADGHMQTLDMPVVRAGPDNDFSLHMRDTPGAGLNVRLSGRSADGTGLGRKDFSGADATAADAKPRTEPFHIEANLERLVMRRGVTMAPFALSASGIGDRPSALALSGTLARNVKLSGDLVREKGERTLRLKTNNAGLLLKGLFGFTSLRGGKLALTATLSPTPTKAEREAKRPPDYRGVLEIDDFTVVNQPFLTRLFSAGSLVGLADLMQGKGIAVDRLEAPFNMHGGVLDIRKARASGPSIGLTADGYLDRRNNKIALEGALAPIYGLNSVLGAIPLLGDVLVSKKGEGIIGMSYSVSGNAEEPKVSVNPLSVLAPGILRRIFEGTPEAPATVAPKPAKPAPKTKADPPATAEPEPKDNATSSPEGGAVVTDPAPTPKSDGVGTAPDASRTAVPDPKSETPPKPEK